jgi:PH (Pleckstrin Homology) domain-containing protein
VGLGLGFGVPFVLSVAMVATSGDLGLLIVPLPFLLGLWTVQGFAPAGFTLEADGVRIERRWLARLIPYVLIRGVDREPRPVGGFGAAGLNVLFGSQGPRWNPRTGWHYLAITNTTDLVYLHTAEGLLVLSPSRPDEFAARLGWRLSGGVGS